MNEHERCELRESKTANSLKLLIPFLLFSVFSRKYLHNVQSSFEALKQFYNVITFYWCCFGLLQRE